MATEIKAVQCPKCGSTQNIEIRPDYFRCSSCGTEYFLDNGARANNVVQAPPQPPAVPPQPPAAPPRKRISKAIAVLFVFLFFALIVGVGLAIAYSGSSPASSWSNTSTGNALPEYESNYETAHLFLSTDGRPVLLSIGYRYYYGKSGDDPVYVSFIDVARGAIIKSMLLPGAAPYTTSDGIPLREFFNGDIYIIYDHTKIYRVTKNAYTVTDVTSELFGAQPELISGVAKVDFILSGVEDGFNLVTNDGKELYYFPLIHKVYTGQELFAARDGFKNLVPGAVEKTDFSFADKNSSYQNKATQLMTFRYMDNQGGPKDDAGFQWRDDDQQKEMVRKEELRAVSYAELTPGRTYFQPQIVCYDSDYLLISYTPTVAASAKRSLQCLNPHTGAIVFTLQLPDGNHINSGIHYKEGFAINNSLSTTYIISLRGDLVKTIKKEDHGF